jgi:Tol biopolymer transport system component
LTLPEKVSISRQVAEAVAAAHQAGIVHRDLKPANILLERRSDGWHSHVSDFGLARELDKTLTAAMVGTPQFMAPEQARGDVDAIGTRTDVWAMGATLYMLLAGAPPFDGPSSMAILRSIEVDDPARLPPSVPRELESIVLRCLEKLPERRYPSALALAEDLAAFERGEPVTARGKGVSRRLWSRLRRRPTLLVATLAALALTAVTLALRHSPEWHPIIRELEPAYEEAASGVVISPDNKWLLFASDRSGTYRIYRQSVEGGPAHLVPTPDNVEVPNWSTDGKAIYFSRSSRFLERLALEEGAKPELVAIGTEIVECANTLFYATCVEGNVCRLLMRRGNQPPRELLRAPTPLRELACSLDGRRVAYTRSEPNRVRWANVADGIEHELSRLGDETSVATFHPDGESLVMIVREGRRRTLWEQRIDGKKARRLTDSGHDFNPTFSADGRLFFNIENRSRVITARPLDGSPPHTLGTASNWLSAITATPDGQELILAGFARENLTQVIALSPATGEERVLAAGTEPTLSPDGETVYFQRLGENRPTIWSVPRRGGVARAMVTLPGPIRRLFAATDGVHVMLNTGVDQHAVLQPYNGSPFMDEQPKGFAQISPAADGFALAMLLDGRSQVVAPPGKKPPAVRSLLSTTLAPDRRSFVGIDDENDFWEVYFDGKERKLFRLPMTDRATISADRKTLYTVDLMVHTRRAELANYAALPRL